MSQTDQLFAGRYRLERRLGVGGMSTVQLAFDTRLERYVAVKLLAEHLAADDAFIARFKREALAAARLVHPNVVQVYDFGSDEGSHRQFIVMEHVEGHSCAELLREHGPMSATDAVDVLVQSCRGLDYAHRGGVVHRDVKPGNLLRNEEGVVKLADFGIAKAAEDSDITRVGSVIGTASYLAPEQSRGEPAGPQSDLYALGVVAYQLLTGRLPYQGSSLTDLARQQDAGPPTAVHELVPGVPPALSVAVMRALEGGLDRRYASAPEMEQALTDGMRGVAPPPLPPEDPTVALTGTAATRMLRDERPRPAPRRRLEPMPAEAAPPRRRRPPAGYVEPAPRRRRPRWGLRLFTLFVLALAVGAVWAYAQAEGLLDSSRVELKEFTGDLSQTYEDLRAVIEDNTR